MTGTVCDAVWDACRAFAKVNAKAPDVMIVDRETGIRLMCEVREQAHIILPAHERLESVVEHPDGSVWREAEVMGVKVRWPANRLATVSGYQWV